MKLFGISGFSGSGKTTLIEGLIPLFLEKGLNIGVVKHAHHSFQIDQKGKDSFKYRSAGAIETVVSSSRRMAYVKENRRLEREPELKELVSKFENSDLVLVEGFKHENIVKLQLIRNENPKEFLFLKDNNIMALVTDFDISTNLPIFRFNQQNLITEFILKNAISIEEFFGNYE